MFLLKWKGYSENFNSWVLSSNLCCSDLLDAYKKKFNLPPFNQELENTTAGPQPTSPRNSQEEHDNVPIIHSSSNQQSFFESKKMSQKRNSSSSIKNMKRKTRKTGLIGITAQAEESGSLIRDSQNLADFPTGHRVKSILSEISSSAKTFTRPGQSILSIGKSVSLTLKNVSSTPISQKARDLPSAIQNKVSDTAYESRHHSYNIADPVQTEDSGPSHSYAHGRPKRKTNLGSFSFQAPQDKHNDQGNILLSSTDVDPFMEEDELSSEPLFVPDRKHKYSLMSRYLLEDTPSLPVSFFSHQLQHGGNNRMETQSRITSTTSTSVNASEGRPVGENSGENTQKHLTMNSERLKVFWGEMDGLIFVENVIDRASPPLNFKFISCNIYNEEVPDLNDPRTNNILQGCECNSLGQNCGPRPRLCCATMQGSNFAYTHEKTIRVQPWVPVYECNTKCTCSSDCINRVVQLGAKIPLCIFRTRRKGWGVKAMQRIKSKSFVSEYLGEVITIEEAERRVEMNEGEGNTYQFDLNFEGKHSAFIVDAANFGNISRYFNHSVS